MGVVQRGHINQDCQFDSGWANEWRDLNITLFGTKDNQNEQDDPFDVNGCSSTFACIHDPIYQCGSTE